MESLEAGLPEDPMEIVTYLLTKGLLDVQLRGTGDVPAIYRTSTEGERFRDYLQLKWKQSSRLLRRFGRKRPLSKEQRVIDLLTVGLSKRYGFGVLDGQIFMQKLDW